MKVSIALCTYNGEKYLAEQLDSIYNQIHRADELIICDDRSNDNTLKIIKQFQEKGLPIKLTINESRLGFIENFSKATSLCTGDIIFLCDQDDIWLPNKITTILNIFQEKNAIQLVFTDAYLINREGEKLPDNLWNCVNLTKNKTVDFLYLLNHTTITGATVAFRKQLLERALPIPEGWIHDAWFGVMASALGDVHPLPEKLILYRQHDNNQIGIKKITWRLFIKKVIRLATTTHTEHASQYVDLTSRLQNNKSNQKHVEQKIQHLTARQFANRHYIKNLTSIIKEIINNRYFIYAYGWSSILRDITLLHYQTIRGIQPPSDLK